MLKQAFDNWTQLMSDNQVLGFLVAYIFVFTCTFLITWLVMLLFQRNWAYAFGWSVAFAAILPFLVLSVLMVISSLFARDEDGKRKTDIKNAAFGAAGIFMFAKAIIDWPKRLGIWMQENLSSEPVKAENKPKTKQVKKAVINSSTRKAVAMPVKTGVRRAPEDGDVVVIDYPNMNAITVCTDVSEDPLTSENAGWSGHPAYRFDYICGVGLNGTDPYPLKGHIWMQDDQQHMSIMGVNGYALPRRFFNIDLVQLFKDNGFDIEFA